MHTPVYVPGLDPAIDYSVQNWGTRFWGWGFWRAHVADIFSNPIFRGQLRFHGARRVIPLSYLDSVVVTLDDNGERKKQSAMAGFLAGDQMPGGLVELGLPVSSAPVIRSGAHVAAARQLEVEEIPVEVFYV